MAERTKILFIEDEDSFREPLSIGLNFLGYEVFEAETGFDGIRMFNEIRPHIVILDIGLPDINGIEVSRNICEGNNIPIIVLTADKSDETYIMAYRNGISNYLPKPCSLEKIDSVIQNSLKKRKHNSQINSFESGHFKINFDTWSAYVDDKPIELTKLQVSILRCLFDNNFEIISYQKIIESVWKQEFSYDTVCLRNQIRQIRKKIEINPNNPKIVTTVKRLGYRLNKTMNKI